MRPGRGLAVFVLLACLLASAAGLGSPGAARAQVSCSVLVCAGAASAIGMDCGNAVDGTGQRFAWCTVTLNAAANGSSPALLPGRLEGSAAGHVAFTCLNGCTNRDVSASVPLAAWWRGGPEVAPLGLSAGAQVGATVLKQTLFAFLPTDGRPACVHANADLVTRATATVPDANGLPVALDRAAAEAPQTAFGNACA